MDISYRAQYDQGQVWENISQVQRMWNKQSLECGKEEKKKSLVALESLGCYPKKFRLSFIGNGEPLKSTDEQRNENDCCALNGQRGRSTRERKHMKQENYLGSCCNSLQQ